MRVIRPKPAGVAAAALALSLVCIATVAASTRNAADVGGPPHLIVGNASSFVSPDIRQGVPTCPSSDGTQHVCYSPSYLQQAYNFPTGASAPTGAGQTIVIVDAYGSPTIAADLANFDTAFGIAAPPSFRTVTTRGTDATDGSNDLEYWGVETSLDVEYAHAMAPGANIELVIAASDDISDVVEAEAEVLPHTPGAIVVQSFGDDENDPTSQGDFKAFHHIYQVATALGETLLASAGDYGATDGNDGPVASYPASDPLVTGVGGTQGNPYPFGLWSNGGYGGETVWNESEYDAATGGAPSVLFAAPSWQQGASRSRARTVPDVSYNAAINGGVLVYYGPNVFTVGATSAGPPQWAAIFALANQVRTKLRERPLGFANPDLYAIASNPRSYRSDFHDIKTGSNEIDGLPGYSAGPGYDLASGLGTPNVTNLIGDLVGASGGDNDMVGWPTGFPGAGGHRHGWSHDMVPGR